MQNAIPKAYEPKDYEDQMYGRWEASGFFNPDVCVERGVTAEDAEPFTIVLPPPNVTGTLHMGHAAMLAIEDVMIRYARMRGKRTLWLPGTDHAAVATESKVENLLIKEEGFKKPKEELGRDAFLARVHKFAKDSHDTIVNQSKKMGSSLDWSREAYTLDEPRNLAVRTVFKKMFDDGLIYRGYRVVNWSVKGQSTCSDDELVYVERPGKLYFFKYSEDFPIPIATTRPETKLGDTAVAVHPEGKWKQYIGQTFTVADFGQSGHTLTIHVIADDGIDETFGTGALGVTTAHSPIDFEMYMREKARGNDIGIVQVIGEDGCMTANAGAAYAGLTVVKAREKVVAWLREQNLLTDEKDTMQNVGTSDRFTDVVEPLPKTQWFVDVNKKTAGKGRFAGRQVSLKEMMAEVVRDGSIEILPDRFNRTYFSWIDNLRDWCISRQVWFGHQIPVWYRGTEVYCGVNAPEGEGWTQDPDSLDTWFSAGLWTFSALGWPTTRVIFVRHGEAENNVAGNVGAGDDGFPLTATGIAQITELAKTLHGCGAVRIISSPVERTRQTSQILADALNIPIEIDDRIREAHPGELGGRPRPELNALRSENKHWRTESIRGVESFVSITERTQSFLKDVAARGETVIVVSHGDPLTVMTTGNGLDIVEAATVTMARGTSMVKEFTREGKLATDFMTFHPTSLLETGYDIIFFWVARMILMTTYTLGEVPFKTVYLHGLVRDEQGRKMSKSLDNIINPLDMIEKYGTDATRLSLLLGSTPGNDVKLSEEKIASFRNFTNKLWNIGRYILSTEGVAEATASWETRTLADRWIVARMHAVTEEVTKALDTHAFSYAGERLRDFTWSELADWYLEASKVAPNPALLRQLLSTLVRLWHPFMPFVTEVIADMMRDTTSSEFVMVSRWPDASEIPSDDTAMREFALVQECVTAVRAMRQTYQMSPSAAVVAHVMAEELTWSHITAQTELICKLARVSSIERVTAVADNTATTAFGWGSVSIPLEGQIDVAVQRTRIEKDLADVTRYIDTLHKKLDNADFVARAAADVVDKEREKLAEAATRRDALTAQLAQLG